VLRDTAKILDQFARDKGRPPRELAEAVSPGYLIQLPRDRWDRELLYSTDGTTYRLGSLGEDGREGGTGEDADLWHDRL
jgi:general secretion pathway protein G